jgi:flagellar hook assembly protein FlgD
VVESLEPRLVLCQNHPNPFGPFTNISFALPEQDLVDLSVYDVRGRLVRRLIHDVMAQGVKEVLWDGTDSRGRRAGSGLYFYRLEAGGQEVNKKMVRLR